MDEKIELSKPVKNPFISKDKEYKDEGIKFDNASEKISEIDKKLRTQENVFFENYSKNFPIEKLKRISDEIPQVIGTYTKSSNNSSENHLNILAKKAIIRDENGKNITIDNREELKKILNKKNDENNTNNNINNDYMELRKHMVFEEEDED